MYPTEAQEIYLIVISEKSYINTKPNISIYNQKVHKREITTPLADLTARSNIACTC